MERIEIFQVLGIAPTRDERQIKDAYREKLSVTNPEDNPEGFKRLRTAFEEACRLAKQQDEADEGKEKDTSPSGIWAAEAAEIYGNMETRRSVERWKKLFGEDIFLSLEEEENCRIKLLRFLMDNYRLPTEVWKLFEDKMHIVEETAKLRERFPADFISFIANKCERGEDVDFDQFEGAPDAPYDLFLKYYEQCFRAVDSGQSEQAEELLRNADELHIFHPVMEVCRAGLYEKQGKVQEAIALMLDLRERYPKDTMVCYNCAELLWRNDRKEDAAAVYESLKEENDSHYMANFRLTEWYYTQKRYQDAKKCAEKILSQGGDDAFRNTLRAVNVEIERELKEHYQREHDYESALELCWCYLQDGKNNAGVRLAKEISRQIPPDREAEYNGLMAKLYVEGADYEDSIQMTELWEKSLQEKLAKEEDGEEKEKDQDRLCQVHMIREQCYRSLGYKKKDYFAKAIEEMEAVETGTSRDIGLLLEKAQVYMEMEEYEKSLDICRRLVEEYQIYAAFATSMEVHVRQWDASGVIRDGRASINYFPDYARAYERMGKVYLDLEHFDELKQLLEEAEKNGIKSDILEAWRYQMDHKIPESTILDGRIKEFRKNILKCVEDGKISFYEVGLPIITEYLYWYPGSYMFVERAIFHKAAHHYEEAKADYEKALMEKPCNPYALNGLSLVYRYQGDYEKALVYLKKAILYMDKDMTPYIYTDLADLYCLLGDYNGALKPYRSFARRLGERDKDKMKERAICLAACGYVEDAVKSLRQINGDNWPDLYVDLTDIYFGIDCPEEIRKTLDEWEKRIREELSFTDKIFSSKNNEAKKFCNLTYFYNRKKWYALIYGEGKEALKYVEKEIRLDGRETSEEELYDAVFSCMLCQDRAKAKQYAGRLKKWLQHENLSGKISYFNSQKKFLHYQIILAFLDKTEDNLCKLLDEAQKCERCQKCANAACREEEALKILYLLRTGKTAEAMEKLQQNMEQKPFDLYLLALRNRLMRQK